MTILRKTLTVIGPHGSEVTMLKPGLGKVIVIAGDPCEAGVAASCHCGLMVMMSPFLIMALLSP